MQWLKLALDAHKSVMPRNNWLLSVVDFSRNPCSVPHIQEVVGSNPTAPTKLAKVKPWLIYFCPWKVKA